MAIATVFLEVVLHNLAYKWKMIGLTSKGQMFSEFGHGPIS